MAFGPDPITAEAARRALVENDRLDAKANDSNAGRAALDAADLRDLERSLYYGAAAPSMPTALPDVVPAPRRSLIARLFRRG